MTISVCAHIHPSTEVSVTLQEGEVGKYAALSAGRLSVFINNREKALEIASLLEKAAQEWEEAPNHTTLYTAPKPVEQQPIKSDLARNAANHLTNWLEMDICECEGGHYCGYNEVKRTRDALLEAAEQQPDVTQLAEALEGLLAITGESLGVSGYHLNGDIAKWCEFDEVAMAEKALTLYRQQGGDK